MMIMMMMVMVMMMTTTMIEIVMAMFFIYVLQEDVHIDCYGHRNGENDDDNKNNEDNIHNFFALQKERHLER